MIFCDLTVGLGTTSSASILETFMETLMNTNLKTVLASMLIAIMTFASLGFSSDADARKRFGGGQSSGMQRDSV